MNLNLPNEFQVFVEEMVVKGRFGSEQDAVVEGIRLLMNQEYLRSEVRKGIEQLEAGKSLDEETVFAEVESAINTIKSEREFKTEMQQ